MVFLPHTLSVLTIRAFGMIRLPQRTFFVFAMNFIANKPIWLQKSIQLRDI